MEAAFFLIVTFFIKKLLVKKELYKDTTLIDQNWILEIGNLRSCVVVSLKRIKVCMSGSDPIYSRESKSC